MARFPSLLATSIIALSLRHLAQKQIKAGQLPSLPMIWFRAATLAPHSCHSFACDALDCDWSSFSHLFLYPASLSWKKELRMFSWKGIRQIFKSQKVKNQKVYCSTFRFFRFFRLFDFSPFRCFDFSTFLLPSQLFDVSPFRFSFLDLYAFAMKEHFLQNRHIQLRKQKSKRIYFSTFRFFDFFDSSTFRFFDSFDFLTFLRFAFLS